MGRERGVAARAEWPHERSLRSRLGEVGHLPSGLTSTACSASDLVQPLRPEAPRPPDKSVRRTGPWYARLQSGGSAPDRSVRRTGRTGRVSIALALVVGVAILGSAAYIAYVRTSADLANKAAGKVVGSEPQAASPLRKWTLVGQVKAGVTEPKGIALGPRGTLYVAGNGAVRVFNADGSPRGQLAVTGGARCIAVDSAGVVYVGIADHVEVFAPDGKLQARWSPAGKSGFVTSIALAADGAWVADAGRRLVDHFDRSGHLLGSIGKRDDARKIPGLITPSPYLDVGVSRAGQIVVTDPGRHTVETYTPQGELSESWGRESGDLGSPDEDGFCGCCNPTDIGLFADGRIATSEKGLARVKIYLPDGTLESLVADSPDISATAAGIDLAVDASGRLWVLDPVARVVKVFARGTSR